MRKLVIMAVTVLGMWATQTSALTIGPEDGNLLGIVTPGTGGEATHLGYITQLISMAPGAITTFGDQTYTRSGNFEPPAQLPSDGLAFAGKWEANDPGFRVNSLNLSGAAYVLAKYDADKGGSVVWYLGNVGSLWADLPSEFNGKGISHFSVFTTSGSSFEPGATLPDGGSTLLLLGAGVLGMVAIRRGNLLRVQHALAVK